MTAIENHIYSKIRNIYAFKSKCFNFQTVFGFKSIIGWFIPLFITNQYNKGHSFLKPDYSNNN